MADFVCPLQQETKVDDPQPQPPCDDEMFLFGQTFKGVRTYSIVLFILLIYFYTIVRGMSVTGIQELAFAAVSYMFGMKVASARR